MAFYTSGISIVMVTDVNKLDKPVDGNSMPFSKLQYKELAFKLEQQFTKAGEYWQLAQPAVEQPPHTEVQFKNGFTIIGGLERASVTYKHDKRAKDRTDMAPSVAILIFEMISNEKFFVEKLGINFLMELDFVNAKEKMKALLNPSITSLYKTADSFDIIYHYPRGDRNVLNLKLYVSEEFPNTLYLDANYHFEILRSASLESIKGIISSTDSLKNELGKILEEFTAQIP